ncbi:MAG: hypothetical protein V4614_14245 [Pseudomonadota bacterium]
MTSLPATQQPSWASGMIAALALTLLAGCQSIPANTQGAITPGAIGSEQIANILASPDRSTADRTNDIRRKPAEMLAFIGIRPGMVAMDLSAGGGYTSELLARAIGPGGRVYGQNPPRDAAAPAPRPTVPEGGGPTRTMAITSATITAATRQTLADRAKTPAIAPITVVTRKFDDPIPPEIAPATLDLATLMFNYHDLGYLGADRAAMNRAVFAALKPGGIYVIADHSGRPGTGISESGTLHRIEEAFLRREIEAAGFRQVASGNFLRNPGDTRDKNVPVPAQPKDEFVLKFLKP